MVEGFILQNLGFRVYFPRGPSRFLILSGSELRNLIRRLFWGLLIGFRLGCLGV